MLKRLSVALAATVSLLGSGLANATPINPHAYDLVVTYNNNSLPTDGMYWVDTTSAEDLQHNSSNADIITKEGWLGIGLNGSYPEWIEAGAIDGNTVDGFQALSAGGSYTTGIFIGYNNCAAVSASQCQSYTDFRESTPARNASGQHGYIIRNSVDTTGNWDVYIDGSKYLTIAKNAFNSNYAGYTEVGIESSDTSNSFTSGTAKTDFWRVDTPNENNSIYGWKANTDGDVYTYTSNIYNGWSNYFTYPVNNGGLLTTSNRINYTHN